MTTTTYHQLPQPDEIPVREREDAMGAYLMMFAAVGAGLPLPIINLIASIVYYYLNKGKSRFVRFHTLQSMLSQLPVSLINAVAVFWGIRIFFFEWEFTNEFKGYLAMMLIANITYVVFSIIGAIKARKGRFYYFLIWGKYAYHQVYSVREDEDKETIETNLPPQ